MTRGTSSMMAPSPSWAKVEGQTPQSRVGQGLPSWCMRGQELQRVVLPLAGTGHGHERLKQSMDVGLFPSQSEGNITYAPARLYPKGSASSEILSRRMAAQASKASIVAPTCLHGVNAGTSNAASVRRYYGRNCGDVHEGGCSGETRRFLRSHDALTF